MFLSSRSNVKLALIVLCTISVASISYLKSIIGDFKSFLGDNPRQLQVNDTDIQKKFVGGFLVPDSEHVVPLTERKPENEIRYASFGASSTWGATLPSRDTQAYVKVLSTENGDNYGIRSSGPNYPAACTETMLGDNEYDVIIFEYLNAAGAGLPELAQRLRERFPDAIFVMLSVYNGEALFTKYYCGTDNVRDIRNPYEKEYGRKFCHESEYKTKIMEYFKENCPDVLTPHEVYVKNMRGYLTSIAKKSNSYVQEDEGLRRTGEDFIRYVDNQKAHDCTHMSVEAHEDTANQIKDLVRRVGVPKTPRVNPYSSSDHCLNWFTTGKIDPGLRYSPNGFVEKMPNTQKYALTFKEDQMDKWIEMTNESKQKMFLFVSHMTTGPAPSNVKYPKAEAVDETGEHIIHLDPVAVWPGLGNKEIHVTKLTSLGEVGPGETKRCYFRILEKDSEWPLRIVQVLLTPKDNYGTSYHGLKEKMVADA